MSGLDVEALLDSTAAKGEAGKGTANQDSSQQNGDSGGRSSRDKARDSSRDRDRERDRDHDRRHRDRSNGRRSSHRDSVSEAGRDTPRSEAGSHRSSRRRSRSRDSDRRHSRRHRGDGDYYRSGRGGRSRSRSPTRYYRRAEERIAENVTNVATVAVETMIEMAVGTEDAVRRESLAHPN